MAEKGIMKGGQDKYPGKEADKKEKEDDADDGKKEKDDDSLNLDPLLVTTTNYLTLTLTNPDPNWDILKIRTHPGLQVIRGCSLFTVLIRSPR